MKENKKSINNEEDVKVRERSKLQINNRQLGEDLMSRHVGAKIIL